MFIRYLKSMQVLNELKVSEQGIGKHLRTSWIR
jgi:hypothetical protein